MRKFFASIYHTSLQIGIKYLIFQKYFFSTYFAAQQLVWHIAFVGTVLKLQNLWKCIMRKCPFGVDGNAERPTDHERAASLVRHTQLVFLMEDYMLDLMRQQSNTWIAFLKELGNDEEQLCRNSQTPISRWKCLLSDHRNGWRST